MNISKFDVGLLFILSLAIVLISFTGPVFGLTDDKATDETDIPELNVNNGTFDALDGFPEEPTGKPSGGTLNFTTYPLGSLASSPKGQGINRQFITGSYQNVNGIEIAVTKYPTGPNSTANILVYEWNSGTLDSKANISVQEGQTINYQNQSQGVVVEFDVTNVNHDLYGNGTQTAETDYQVQQTPSDTGFFNNLPVVGGAIDGANALGRVVGWIGSTIFYLFLIAGETAINTFVILTNVMTYIIDLLSWMTGTYLGVVDNAPGWSRVIVAVPGVLFGAVLGKFVAVGVSLLPTT
jgi:hypothetical protein